MIWSLKPLDDESYKLKTVNTQDGARLDIAMDGFWGGRHERCYTDIRVLSPLLPLTVELHLVLATESMSYLRRELMTCVPGKWSTAPSHL